MAFDADRDLKREIDRGIVEGGFVGLRMEDLSGPGLLPSVLWQTLKNARCVIADLTGRNPNVYYELGLAHAIGKPTVLITASIEDVPFDLQHLRIIRYDRNELGPNLRRHISNALHQINKDAPVEA